MPESWDDALKAFLYVDDYANKLKDQVDAENASKELWKASWTSSATTNGT